MGTGRVEWTQGGWGGHRAYIYGGICKRATVYIDVNANTHTHTHTPDLPQGQVLEPDLGQSPHDPV